MTVHSTTVKGYSFHAALSEWANGLDDYLSSGSVDHFWTVLAGSAALATVAFYAMGV